jgi:hypothetical protein
VFGLIKSAFFWQKGQQAYFTPLIFRINACPFHGSGGFMYSEKSIPSDSNADLMLIYFFLTPFRPATLRSFGSPCIFFPLFVRYIPYRINALVLPVLLNQAHINVSKDISVQPMNLS